MPPADPRTSRPRRPWLRVSLRTLMILVVVIAVPAGWVATTIRTQRAAIEAVRAAKGTIRFDWQVEQVGTAPNGRAIDRKEPAAPAWLRRWLGDELFQVVGAVQLPGRATPEALAALGRFARLEDFRLGDSTGVGDGVRHLRGLRQLKIAWVAGPGITDAMLADLSRVPSLRNLQIGIPLTQEGPPAIDPKASPTDAGFTPLAGLSRLESLTIGNCPNLTDAGLVPIVAGLPALRTMVLAGGPRSLAAALPVLARRHPDLVSLGLDGTGVADADLAAVAGLARLGSLRLGHTRVTAAGLAHLRGSKSLTVLMATGTALGDDDLATVGELTGLTYLSLSDTKVTDAGLAHLARLTALKRLDLYATGVTDAGMPALARLAGLETLGLAQVAGLTDAGLVPLRGLTHLQQLGVGQTRVTARGIAALRQAIPALTVRTARVVSRGRPVWAPTPAPAAK